MDQFEGSEKPVNVGGRDGVNQIQGDSEIEDQNITSDNESKPNNSEAFNVQNNRYSYTQVEIKITSNNPYVKVKKN